MKVNFNIIRIFIVFFCLLISVKNVSAQKKDKSNTEQGGNDAALWLNVYLEKKLNSRFNIHINEVVRYNHNLTRMYYSYTDVGTTFKIKDWWHATLDYVFVTNEGPTKNFTGEFVSIRHQLYFDMAFKRDFGDFRVNYRTMLQAQIKDVYSSKVGAIPNWYFRNKITIKYTLSRRIMPYVASEIYYQFATNLGDQFDRARFYAGMFYHLSTNNDLEAYYMIQKQFNIIQPSTDYVIGLGYAHYFK
jgi:hypothetical protein